MNRMTMRVAALALAVGLAGCRSETKTASPGKHYPIRGVVQRVDGSDQSVMLKHEAIPGFMEAMTMEYRVTDPAALGEMHQGDVIAATLLADEDAAGPKNLRLSDVVIVAQAKPDYKPLVQYHVPVPGEMVPDFRLMNQSGKLISLQQYRGKVVAMTFIYTRCPLADYCPRMSRNFAEMDRVLAVDKNLYARTHLISVSFDPEYDTPKVLKSYGAAYTGKYVNETFQHWDFAAPPQSELVTMEQFFDVGVTPGEKGSLQHSLSTVILGRDGKVVAFYPTKDWSVDEVLAKIKAAANQ